MATYMGKFQIDSGDALPIGSTLYGTCDTAAGTAAKVVTMANFDELITGVTIHVKMTNANSVANPTLNVNGTGAKDIMRYGTTRPSTNANTSWNAGSVVSFTYDGTYWQMNDYALRGNDNTVPSAYCSTAAGTAAKAATATGFVLKNPCYLHLVLTVANTVQGAITLNVNGTGAKPIYINGAASSASNYTLPAGSYIIYYNGTNWYIRTDGLLTGAGLVDIGGNTGKFLRGDGTWQTPENTTYSSLAAASGGTAVSLVTTGEKYTWNQKLSSHQTIKQDGVTGATVNRYGTCSTAAATAAKTATITTGTFTLETGAVVHIKMTNSNTVANPTLNVNSTGAKAIMRYGSTTASTNANTSWYAGTVVTFIYDGTNWLMADFAHRANDNTVPMAYCSTAAATAAKVASFSGFVLRNPCWFLLTVTAANTAASAITLNVNSTGAKPIYINGAASSASNYTLPAGVYYVYYNGTNYYIRTDSYATGLMAEHYGSCSTAAATAAKTVACPGFSLITGAQITVKFTVTNTAANPTLNVNSTGAKAIYYRGAAITAGYLAANRTYRFVYNGTQYEVVGDIDTNTTYTAMTAAEATAGTVTAQRTISPKIMKDEIDNTVKPASVTNAAVTETYFQLSLMDCCMQTGKTLIVSGEIKIIKAATDNTWHTVGTITASLACDVVYVDVASSGQSLRIRLYNDTSAGNVKIQAAGSGKTVNSTFRFNLIAPVA